VFPGCGDTRFTHAHHIEHWANGGETSLSNLATLCGWHHRHLHEGGYRVEVGALGDFTFYRRDGSVVSCGVPGAASGHSGDLGIALDPDDTLSRYDGSRLDLEWIFPDLFRNDSRLPKDWPPAGAEPPGSEPPGSGEAQAADPPGGEAEAGDDNDDEEWLPVPPPPDPPDEPPPAWLLEEPPEDRGPPGPSDAHPGGTEPKT
jgi:hypothetical protein